MYNMFLLYGEHEEMVRGSSKFLQMLVIPHKCMNRLRGM